MELNINIIEIFYFTLEIGYPKITVTPRVQLNMFSSVSLLVYLIYYSVCCTLISYKCLPQLNKASKFFDVGSFNKFIFNSTYVVST